MIWTDPETTHHEPGREPHAPSTRSGWHLLNVGHLVMGAAFVGLTVVWALVASDTLELADHRWLLPAPWILAGAIGLVASAASNARRAPSDDVPR